MAYTRRVTLGLSADHFGQANSIDVYFYTDDGVLTGPFNNSTTSGMVQELSNGLESEATFLIKLSIESGFAGAVVFADSGGMVRAMAIDPEDE